MKINLVGGILIRYVNYHQKVFLKALKRDMKVFRDICEVSYFFILIYLI